MGRSGHKLVGGNRVALRVELAASAIAARPVLLLVAVAMLLLGPLRAAAIASIVTEPSSDPIAARRTIGGDTLVNRETALRERLEQLGDRAADRHELGRILYRQGRVDEAVQQWTQASERDANLAPAQVAIVQELRIRGELDAAEKELATVASNLPNSTPVQGAHVQLEQGQLALVRGDAAAAEAAFVRALELAPDLYITNFMQARFLDLTKRPAEAEKLFRRATELDPKRAEGWVFLAARLFDDGNIEQSLAMLQQAEACDPSEQIAEVRLAELYRVSNDLVGARHWLQAALSRQPQNVYVLYRLGEIAAYFKRDNEAREHFQASLQITEALPTIIALGQLAQRQGNLPEALRLYRRAVEIEPTDFIANNNLAMTLVQARGSADEALACAAAARKAHPSSHAENTYGCALWLAGRNEEARNVLRPTLKQLPADPWTRFVYGSVLHALGEHAEAKMHLEGCLLLDADFPRRLEVQQLLAKLSADGEQQGQVGYVTSTQ